MTVHAPVGAIPGGNLEFTTFTDTGYDDQHIAFRNDATQVETDMWLAPLAPNTTGGGTQWDVGYGGLFPYSSGGIAQGGATSAGFSLTVGHVRPVDLQAGVIPYALVFSEPCENGHVAPATGNDNVTPNPNCPPIGARLWLDSSSTDIANSGALLPVKVILNALHTYGGYIGDEANNSLQLAPEGGLAYQAFGLQNPWIPLISQYWPTEAPRGQTTRIICRPTPATSTSACICTSSITRDTLSPHFGSRDRRDPSERKSTVMRPTLRGLGQGGRGVRWPFSAALRVGIDSSAKSSCKSGTPIYAKRSTGQPFPRCVTTLSYERPSLPIGCASAAKRKRSFIAAVMRQLLTLTYGVLKSDRAFDLSYAPA